jgi:hypothetical protein
MIRSFDTETQLHLRGDDGRTVEGLIVPFGRPTDVVERDEVTGEIVQYREQFLPGSLTAMSQMARRRGNWGMVRLTLDHEDGFASRVGYATNVEQIDEGGFGTFRLYRSAELEKVQSMIEESHQGLSVEFSDIGKARTIDGVVSRTQVYVDAVSAVPVAAYADARVLAMRGGELTVETPALDEVAEWLASIGAPATLAATES